MNIQVVMLLFSVAKLVISYEYRVAYGSAIDPEKYPYVVNIISRFFRNSLMMGKCTGSLISRSVVLTAGHCVRNKQFSHTVQFMKLRGATTILHKEVGVSEEIFTKEGELETADYEISDSTTASYVDLALISLNEPLPVCEDNNTRTYSVLQLPIVDIYAEQWAPEAYELNDCMILGYGGFEKGDTDGQLRELKNVIIEDDGSTLYAPFVMEGRVCSGDSGGPVVCSSGRNQYHAIGVVSYSDNERDILPQCYGDDVTFERDIFVDIRRVLPLIKEGLIQLGKLDEFLEDNVKCSLVHNSRQETIFWEYFLGVNWFLGKNMTKIFVGIHSN